MKIVIGFSLLKIKGMLDVKEYIKKVLLVENMKMYVLKKVKRHQIKSVKF